MDAITIEEIRHTNKRYGATLQDQYAKQERIEEDALEAMDNDAAMWEIIADFSDQSVVINLLRVMVSANEVNNDAGLLTFAKSLAVHLKESAIKREMLA